MTSNSKSLSRQKKILSKKVSVICTGGTFDKVYDPVGECLVLSGQPAAERILKAAQVQNPSLLTVTQKDSLDLTGSDLDKINEAIETCLQSHIVVVHGTSRLIETSKYIKNSEGKTIVFTGAMVPSSIDATEASFNLGFAMASALLLPPGIWIAMSGDVFSPTEVVKNTRIARFERK